MRRAATAYPSTYRALDIAVQFVPSVLVARVALESPAATHTAPFHATLQQSKLKGWVAAKDQVIPSELLARQFPPALVPPATHIVPFHATVFPQFSKMLDPPSAPTQLDPSEEYAIVDVPGSPLFPVATHRLPLYAIAWTPASPKITLDACEVQFTPS